MPKKNISEFSQNPEKQPVKVSSNLTEETNGTKTATEDVQKAGALKPAALDEFGLPIKAYKKPPSSVSSDDDEPEFEDAVEDTKMAASTLTEDRGTDNGVKEIESPKDRVNSKVKASVEVDQSLTKETQPPKDDLPSSPKDDKAKRQSVENTTAAHSRNFSTSSRIDDRPRNEQMVLPVDPDAAAPGVRASEWSHQLVVPQKEKDVDKKEEESWQEMPAFAPFDLYDDDGKLVAREAPDSDVEADPYAMLGGAGKGYTKINLDEDAQSATSMDEDTKYLFKEPTTNILEEEDEDQRDPLSQMQFSKHLLTEGQRIAYVGMVRLATVAMIKAVEDIPSTRGTKKELATTVEALKMWAQKMMIRLYAHMEISSAEQIMIEQLAEHGVVADDLTPALMRNSRVRNPMAEGPLSEKAPTSEPGTPLETTSSPRESISSPVGEKFGDATQPPPPYQEQGDVDELPKVRTPSQMTDSKNIDIDLRWTVLCDLFLVLIADSVYDSRSRVLLERVGEYMDVPWLAICKFEKRVTDALEMQEAPNKENWNEDEHKENRRKENLRKRYMMMGLATVGGSLVIGLSAGLLAPVIGAGLAAGFTTIGVAGTGGFLAGAGGAAIITSTAALSGGVIAVRASSRRTGAVKTFEYRPLHNNKRVNLIVTVSGWMTGKVDDVRLPYSTVDPVMGDLYSILWEPDMLQSVGETINIIATEALTQGLQQVLGSTLLVGLMAGLQLPIVLSKLAYLIDNPWTVSVERATAAGLILADSLIDRNLGVRPVTLVGYSLGSRVIFSCLRELAAKGAYGIVQNVYLFGSPVVAKKDEYLRARTVVSGRFVNGYARNDWILGYLFRATSGGIMRVAGLAPVEEIPGLENIEVTSLVAGHMAYRAAMPRLMREVGWSVESDEFTEIEEPDPDGHRERQRELIAELDEARKNLEKGQPQKKKFSLFSRNKRVEKKDWETYDESTRDDGEVSPRRTDEEGSSGMLFDIDAIRAELANEEIVVKQLESTLPPMKLDLNSKRDIPNGSPRVGLTHSQSAESGLPMTSPAPYQGSSTVKSATSVNSLGGSVESPLSPIEHRDETDSTRLSFEPSESSPYLRSPMSPDLRSSFEHHPQGSPLGAPQADRPPLKTAQTMPAHVMSIDHNAWADEDDEFGKEKEVTMSFE